LLLQLADKLLQRAEVDPKQPIPVVFHLESWAEQNQPLASWLKGELTANYKVPRDTASLWLEDSNALVLLLDGLDEVAEGRRAECAEAINAYRQEHGLVAMAVCGRTQEVEG